MIRINIPRLSSQTPAYYLGRPAAVYVNRFGSRRQRRNGHRSDVS